ncbi:hypothetical protein [Microbacterium sp. PRC9]|uniref:hypothetical protein n=1 Tax=Microbacterium sp. PRC9 TaxID=2962591 RepID=UPI002880DD94|nr:hypothetical protein [Microbacterium sp. PRC9]MDT0142794.1 hypothetical protein [Microbacterium sp. PRC9]
MARGPIEIPVGIDTGPFEKGVKNGLIEPVEDAQEALEKLGDTNFGKDIDKELDKAQDATKDLDKELDETRKSLDKLSYASKDVGDGAKKGFGNAKDASNEFKEEALSNLSEVTSSFDGSMESVGELVQGTLGGVTAAIPGIGIAAAGAAAAVGVITDTWSKVEEATNEAKESAYDYAFSVIESGEIIAQSEAIKDYTSDIDKMKQAQDIAAVSGWDLKDVVSALATGDGLPALNAAFNEGANNTMTSVARVNELQGALTGTAQGLEAGAVGADIYTSKLYEMAIQSGTATGEVDDLGNAIYELPGGKEVVVNAKTQTAYEDLDALERKNLTPKTQTVKFAIDTSAYDNWRPNPKSAIIRGVPQAW